MSAGKARRLDRSESGTEKLAKHRNAITYLYIYFFFWETELDFSRPFDTPSACAAYFV